ncbi:DUF6506 family protein [Pectobacterium polaris]|uniref:DUF6506 family protein n=1 Tax=Pectobacterium polaris TaxID=2042057 RepID=UPI00202DB400|nr:DUF6506 family protein [Pectobacterium polaris]MCL6325738.1 hypothetical protein [Pectobacterium polaris]
MVSWAFIFKAPETNPKTDRFVIERGGMRNIIVAVPEQIDVVQISVELVKDGVQFIELCGGFEPIWVGKIIEATGGEIPVGHVGFSGPDSVARIVKIFANES